MPDWKALAAKPAGALPANLTTKAAVALLTVLVMALVVSAVLTGDDPEEDAAPGPHADPAQQPVSDAGMTRRLQTEIDQQQRRDDFRAPRQRTGGEPASASATRSADPSPIPAPGLRTPSSTPTPAKDSPPPRPNCAKTSASRRSPAASAHSGRSPWRTPTGTTGRAKPHRNLSAPDAASGRPGPPGPVA